MVMESVSSSVSPPPPVHVAIIMDGNRRWAKARGLPRALGHKRGADTVRRVVEAARDMGISYLTLYAFSAENWKRPPSEVTDLMGLLRLYLHNEVASLNRNGVRLRVIGDRSRLGPDIVALIEQSEAKTAANVQMTLILALSYGGRQEIVQAARRLVEDVRAGRLDPADIDECALSQRMFTEGIPDPDLVIRTSGELRVSNFLLWQSAYAEFVFSDVLWPDFGRPELEAAIRDFHGRERRYGNAVG